MKKLPKKQGSPERKIQEAVEDMLRIKGWFVKRMHGSEYQNGVPDDFATHSRYGARWIEIKRPNMRGSKFTPAQMENFPKFIANGSGVWILTAATEKEYDKLFEPCNYWQYLNVWRQG